MAPDGTREAERIRPVAGYLMFGEETFLAEQLISDLKRSLPAGDSDEGQEERLSLESHSWRDVLDTARMAPLFSTVRRLLVVGGPARGQKQEPSSAEKISAADRVLIAEYFADPAPNTVIICIFPGKFKPGAELVKFFRSLPPDTVEVREMKALSDRDLKGWIPRRFAGFGKSVSAEAVDRLIELTGSNLRLLSREIEKIVTFVDTKTRVEADDVNQISGWVKAFVAWEVSNALERADYSRCVLVIRELLEKEGILPTRILEMIAVFFRNALLVKLRLKEGAKDRKAIFREIKPQIQEKFRRLYEDQFRLVFDLAEALDWADLQRLQDDLKDVDVKLKSGGLSFQVLIEAFLFRYCRMRRRGRPRLP